MAEIQISPMGGSFFFVSLGQSSIAATKIAVMTTAGRSKTTPPDKGSILWITIYPPVASTMPMTQGFSPPELPGHICFR